MPRRDLFARRRLDLVHSLRSRCGRRFWAACQLRRTCRCGIPVSLAGLRRVASYSGSCRVDQHLRQDFADLQLDGPTGRAGTFGDEAGRRECVNCDYKGDFFQELHGQTYCTMCAENTIRRSALALVGLTGANRTACQCKEGTRTSGRPPPSPSEAQAAGRPPCPPRSLCPSVTPPHSPTPGITRWHNSGTLPLSLR